MCLLSEVAVYSAHNRPVHLYRHTLREITAQNNAFIVLNSPPRKARLKSAKIKGSGQYSGQYMVVLWPEYGRCTWPLLPSPRARLDSCSRLHPVISRSASLYLPLLAESVTFNYRHLYVCRIDRYSYVAVSNGHRELTTRSVTPFTRFTT